MPKKIVAIVEKLLREVAIQDAEKQRFTKLAVEAADAHQHTMAALFRSYAERHSNRAIEMRYRLREMTVTML